MDPQQRGMDSTCLVGIQHTDGQVEYISVAWNGRGVGEVLYQHYNTREKVVELIHQGSRPFLEHPDEIINEDMEPPEMVPTYQAFFRVKTSTPEYYYIFTTDNSWVVYSIRLIPPIQTARWLYQDLQ
jgi:hypothetical protein